MYKRRSSENVKAIKAHELLVVEVCKEYVFFQCSDSSRVMGMEEICCDL